ncbi:hypothetical protein BGZ83_002083 [Gryganskiella cystojenkinii]|nr:hypothetical protein BGZ83_002083 [Gryganskiella cystojenkinii]
MLSSESKSYFQDNEQIGVNFTMCFMALWVFFRPQTSYWWAAGRFRRMISCGVMAGVGGGFAINQLINIQSSGDPLFAADGTTKIGYSTQGCHADKYDLTRNRCFIQLGVSSVELLWALLVLLEGCIWVGQRSDKEWHARKANFEVQNAVLYQPTITLPSTTAGLNSNHNVVGQDPIELNEVRVVASEAEGTEQASTLGDESLPNYTHKASMGQPAIIDATNPPERLREAIDRLQSPSNGSSSESVPQAPSVPTLATSSTLPPSYSEKQSS